MQEDFDVVQGQRRAVASEQRAPAKRLRVWCSISHHLFIGIKTEASPRAPIDAISAKADRMIHMCNPPINDPMV
jgi:hypothetical protein